MSSSIHIPQTASATELEQEQAYIDHAFACLEASKGTATHLRDMVESKQGGTHQARYERDVIEDQVARRLTKLEIGDRSLCFGRLDMDAGHEQPPDAPAAATAAAAATAPAAATAGAPASDSSATNQPTYYVGRVGVWDAHHNPVVVDWRAPISAPFYRATGLDPQGVYRRRHFASRGRQLLRIEDEYLSELDLSDDAIVDSAGRSIRGIGTVREFLAQSRTGQLGDIVATIQAEQDEVIRSELPGVLVVQGGPGTGKTVVALHRAAYLLYTHRFPLEGQGVLIAAPNRLFANYIEVVLPSLGEAGAVVATPAELLNLPEVTVKDFDDEAVARIKGDPRMAQLIRKAIRDRRRPLKRDFAIDYWPEFAFSVAESRELIDRVSRHKVAHNTARQQIEEAFFSALAALAPDRTVDPDYPFDAQAVREEIGSTIEARRALEWMWPTFTPAQLLLDLFSTESLLHSAGQQLFSPSELELLKIPRDAERTWTVDDVPLLDEAQHWLGMAKPIRTYGHVVVDEAQDLSPMQLRMLARRSRNGSMTLVGDMAQATSPMAPESWRALLGLLPKKWNSRLAELSVGYRLPAPISEYVADLLANIDSQLKLPVAVQQDGAPPKVVAAGDDLAGSVVQEVTAELAQELVETVAVIVADDQLGWVGEALAAAGIDFATPYSGALEKQVSVLPVRFIKGIEVDVAIVVEPQAIVEQSRRGLQSLYVALTRAIRRLVVVHSQPLPAATAGAGQS